MGSPECAVVATLGQVDAVYRLVTTYPQVFGFAATADELERVWSEVAAR